MKVTNVRKPPLDIIAHFFTDVHIKADSKIIEGKKDNKELGCNFSMSADFARVPNKDREHQVELTIKSEKDKELVKAYDINISVVGIFKVDKNFPVEREESMVGMVAPTILYGAIRELLYSITSRGPYPAVYLPTTSFIPAEDGIELKDEKAKSKKKKTS